MKILLISAKDIFYKERFKVIYLNSISELLVRYSNIIIFQNLNLDFITNSFDIKEFIIDYNRNANNIVPISMVVIIYNDYIE